MSESLSLGDSQDSQSRSSLIATLPNLAFQAAHQGETFAKRLGLARNPTSMSRAAAGT